MHIYPILFSIALMASCSTTAVQNSSDPQESKQHLEGLSTAYFASGCFWCVEAIYESVRGVAEVYNGYSGGHTQNPSYKSSNTGRTGHAEAVEVHYDPDVVSYETLVLVYYASQDPTTINGQGPDHGSQYRSIIFYKNDVQKAVANQYKSQIAAEYTRPIATEILAFDRFWMGEDYHQDYERLHPNQSYIRAVSIPRLRRFQKKHPELLKEEH